MQENTVFEAIAALNLDQIKTKLTHASGEGWSPARANAIELEYRRFLYLMYSYPNEQVAPTVDVDTFWHYHILDTMKYAADCERTFGCFLHHDPYAGLDSAAQDGAEARGGNRMKELYEHTFGEDYIRAEAYGVDAVGAGTASGADAAYCMLRMPAQHAGAEAAYCMLRTPEQKAGADVAYCMLRTPVSKAGAEAAYCMLRAPASTAGAEAAYCMLRAPVKVAGAATAYCMLRTPVKAAGAESAYCMLRTPVRQAGAEAAYCMLRAPIVPARSPAASPVTPA